MDYWNEQIEYYDEGDYIDQDLPEYRGDDQLYRGEYYSDGISVYMRAFPQICV